MCADNGDKPAWNASLEKRLKWAMLREIPVDFDGELRVKFKCGGIAQMWVTIPCSGCRREGGERE